MFERFITRLAFVLFGIIVFMALTNTAKATEIIDSDVSNWSSSGGWGTCHAYSNNKPCVSNGSYFSGDGVGSGDVIFSYTSYYIYKSFSIPAGFSGSTMYLSLDAMTGPGNSNQGNKTEYLIITVIQKDSSGNTLATNTINENITNTTMSTFDYTVAKNASTSTVELRISGRDGGYWNGNYGAVIGSGTLSVNDGASSTPTYTSSISSAQTTQMNNARGVTHDGNGIYITQSGNNNTINVTQDGNDNLIAGGSTTNSIVDATITGNNNNTNMTQRGDNNVILFDIAGDYNSATVNQGGASGADDNRILMDINGDHNTVSSTQTHNNGVGNNGHFLSLDIDGNYNNILTSQTNDGDKKAFISAQGNNNDIDLYQQGSGSHYVEIDVGSNQTVDVTQDGSGNHNASISMSGYSATLDLTQDSSTDQTYSLSQNCINANGCGTTTVVQN